ncbi:Glutathione S-transferase domain [Burkholderia ambifaria MEX-5]|uniref:Glutathione S-transferase domain n=2 Tax=Burkholderia ambifaria TaxID=152480 RepID=B1TF65_9BURK|nr:Glutathione S-transferase domain [Burkholderia ambifaria MEX-5]
MAWPSCPLGHIMPNFSTFEPDYFLGQGHPIANIIPAAQTLNRNQTMSHILYYTPGAASMAVHWILLELGVPLETRLVNIDSGAQRDPEYLRLNSSGRVPTLVINGIPRGESTALLMLLAEQHPESGLAPQPNSPARSAWFEMVIYLAKHVVTGDAKLVLCGGRR